MRIRLLSCLLATAIGVILPPMSARAQVGTIELPYPGWISSDQVEETIVVSELYDSTSSTWRYEYTVVNGFSAAQDIWELALRQDAWITDAEAPAGWDATGRTQDIFDPTGPGIEGTSFLAILRDEFEGRFWPPSDYQIPPGGSLAGFAQESPYPPGYVRTYTQGYSGSPWERATRDDVAAYEAMNPTPHDTTNSQRSWTLGPTIYREIVTGGNRRPATDGFLGFMNLAEKGSVLIDPAPIALKFSLNGETVMRETLEVTLNGVDVTSAFLPGPPDGADLVGVFRRGSSPLQAGKNVLLTTVDGIVPSNGNVGKDADRMTFDIVPNADGLSSNGLNNLPFPDLP